jgi:hypothetical protein
LTNTAKRQASFAPKKSGLAFRHDALTFASGGMTDELARAEIEAKINSSKDVGHGMLGSRLTFCCKAKAQ